MAVNEQVPIRVVGDRDVAVALLRDLSISGACIRTDVKLSRGDLIQIRANADTPAEFEFTATVVDSRPSEMGFFSDYGLRMVELNVESARAMHDYIESHVERPPADALSR